MTPGIYAHPAASVEDMYRPQFSARTATGMMEVDGAVAMTRACASSAFWRAAALASPRWPLGGALRRSTAPIRRRSPARLAVSTEVLDRDGALLRALRRRTAAGGWTTSLDQVDPQFVQMLIAYEDKRFFDHDGVDPLALLRAARQFASNGRIVSGGSTLSMQVARLIEPRESRSFGSKLLQMLRAIQIERRLTKTEILERYLTLAPYGGNLEGVRAASPRLFRQGADAG